MDTIQEKRMKELKEIRERLKVIGDAEATRLYRRARNLQKRGGSQKTVNEIREEANILHSGGYPERYIDTSIKWKHAFKI